MNAKELPISTPANLSPAMDYAKSEHLRKESAAAHSRWMGAMRVQNALMDHLSPAAVRELKKLLAVLQDDYEAASKANSDYHSQFATDYEVKFIAQAA
jgi:hypothetical protein